MGSGASSDKKDAAESDKDGASECDADEGAAIWNLPDISDCRSTSQWTETSYMSVDNPLNSIKVSFTWKDQGWGNQKGALDIRLYRGSTKIADQRINDSAAPHSWDKVTKKLSKDMPVVSKARAGDNLRMRYLVGGGGGHELHVKQLRIYLYYETSSSDEAELEDKLRKTVDWTPSNIDSSIASDDFNEHETFELNDALKSLTISFTWNDQGWGNQKGSIALCLLRGQRELARIVTENVAPHRPAKYIRTIGSDDPIIGESKPGDSLCLRFRVGAGGGHKLQAKDLRIVGMSAPLLSSEDLAATLSEALQGTLAQLKQALFVASQQDSLDTDEAQKALEVVADEMKFPPHWDWKIMQAISMNGAPTYELDDEDDNVNLFATASISDLEPFQNLFDESFRRKYTRDRKGEKVPERLRVKFATRIQNAQMWKEYVSKQKEIEASLESSDDGVDALKTAGHFENIMVPMESSTNTAWLFHGTSLRGADGIAKQDFRVDFAGSNAGTLYGNGIYLAESCAKADEYAEEDGDGLRRILVCRAALGKVLYCDEKAPDRNKLIEQCVDGPYHSVLGDREKVHGTFRELVVYDEDQVYPEFVVCYEREY
eukprot:TRINITY_DN8946_c0_g1_i1.p1 TRINITY_DN8946_c0_g1~~TRINITY_DN8946_c0_g1_i1.p1  ORF type:complete len:601 (+),score=96.21 TRINITY_DN8946_c0_g1_i1:43-1845(+)